MHHYTTTVDRICEFCKRPFQAPPYRVRKGEARFCSTGCARRQQHALARELRSHIVYQEPTLEFQQYMAGIFDGEGSVHVELCVYDTRNGKRIRVSPYLRTAYFGGQETLEEARRCFGGHITTQHGRGEGRKDLARWELANRAAILRFIEKVGLRTRLKRGDLMRLKEIITIMNGPEATTVDGFDDILELVQNMVYHRRRPLSVEIVRQRVRNGDLLFYAGPKRS